ncbi:MAG: hypothetical protein ACRD6X_04240 [Pyrinomonadaceae bacterium]
MDVFKGKSASERNKMIAAIVLGVLAVASLIFAFGPGLFSRSSATTVTVSVSPSPSVAPTVVSGQFKIPSAADQQFDYLTTPVVYSRGDYYAPDSGRNIFAFYEPPTPTPWSPTPFVVITPKPTPTPTPLPYLIGFVQPQSVYEGSRGFRIEVSGDKFTPDAKIYFSQSLLPTNFVSPQRLTADVPANFVAGAGPRQIIVQSLDGTKYSNQTILSVQLRPRPQLQFIGMISRKYANNDTAYFIEQSRMNQPGAVPFAYRLNDILEGRFRLVSISSEEVFVEDVNLGFRHSIKLFRPAPGTTTTGGPGGFPTQGFPNNPTTIRPGSIPGFPNQTIPAPRPNANRPVRNNPAANKIDVDEDDDDEPR